MPNINLDDIPLVDDFVDDGAIHAEPSPTDYHAGSSPIPFEVRNPSADWRNYLPVGEVQYGKQDYMDCVSRSLTNSIEIQYKYLTGQEFNKSERLLAILGETTRTGAYLAKVVEAAKNIGLADQSSYPDSGGTWDEQHAPIPKELFDKLIAECNRFLQDFDIKYEWVATGFGIQHWEKALQHAPIQVVFPNHAVVCVAVDGNYVIYFDSYSPFLKKRHIDQFRSALKIVLTPKKKSMIGYKKVGDATTYVAVGSNMVPVADWAAFQALGGSSETVVELSAEQFAKFKLVGSVLFKSK